MGLGESSLMYLREKFPDDYSKIIEIFPYAEAQVFRAMQRQQKEVAV